MMGFKKAKIITSDLFMNLSPINVFHKEIEESNYIPEVKYQNKHILFRKRFDAENINKTILRISADDYYKIYINGRFVTQGPAPSYNFAYYYNEIDISDYIVKEQNVIAVHTYYQGLINRVWVSGDLRHMFVCEVEQQGRILTATDTTWRYANHSGYDIYGDTYGYDTGFCESYDANAKEVGFEQVNFDDSNWHKAVVKNKCYYKFVIQPTAQLDIYNQKPTVIEKNAKGYFVDVGREVVGYVTFKVTGNEGDVVYIKSGEELTEQGEVRYKLRCNCTYKEKFVLAQGVSEYMQYDYKAFRYIQLDIPPNVQLDVASLKIVVRHYPFVARTHCQSDDIIVNKIWNLCVDTLKYGTQEVLMDCPTREKGQYLGDATISGIAYTILTKDTTFMKKVLRDFANTSFIADSLMSVSVSSLMQEIADYSLQFPLQVLWLYNYGKDKEFLVEMYPYVKGIIDDFRGYERADGLVELVTDKWNLIDWPRNLRDNYDFELSKPIGEGAITVVNAFYYGAVVAYEKISEIMGIKYEKRSQKLCIAFNNAFFCKEQWLYCDSEMSKHASLHANVLPLLFKMNKDYESNLVEFVDKKGIGVCGVYMAMFVLMALKNAGHQQLVLKHILSEGAWLKMLSQGATTCFEAWGKEDKHNTSLFHPWATAPIIALTDTVFPF